MNLKNKKYVKSITKPVGVDALIDPDYNNEKHKNNQNAITLIALTISIIVLLILAGVTLKLVVGEDGITEKAITASKTYDIAGAKEQVDTLVASYAGEFYEEKYISGNADATNIANYIAKQLKANESTVGDYEISTDDTKNTIVITNSKNGNTAKGKITEDGKVEWGNFWEYANDDKTEITDGTQILKIGDYVNYDPEDGATVTEITSYGTENGYGDQLFKLSTYNKRGYGWRVWEIDETTNQIMLISDYAFGPDSGGTVDTDALGRVFDDGGPTEYYLKGKKGYENGIYELNKVCSLYGYGRFATGARSINIEDVDRKANYKPKEKEKPPTSIERAGDYGVIVTYSRNELGNISWSTDTGFSREYENSNSYMPNFYWFDENTKSWNNLRADDAGKSVVLKNTSYSYVLEDVLDKESIYFKLLLSDNSNKDYPGTDYYYDNENRIVNYWLASKSFNLDPNGGDVINYRINRVYANGVGGNTTFHGSDTSCWCFPCGVRPIVYLQKDINLKKSVISGEWNFVE